MPYVPEREAQELVRAARELLLEADRLSEALLFQDRFQTGLRGDIERRVENAIVDLDFALNP